MRADDVFKLIIPALSHRFSLSNKNTLKMDGNVPPRMLLKKISETEKDFPDLPGSVLSDTKIDHQIKTLLLTKLISELPAPPKEEKKFDYSAILVDGRPITDLQLIINRESRRNSFLYDEDKDKKIVVDFSTVTERVNSLGRGAYGAYEVERGQDFFIRYSPNASRKYEHLGERYFNIYSHPSWRKEWTPPESKTSSPPWFRKLMFHLMPGRENPQRTDFLKVMRDALFTRAVPVTVLVGAQGVGKGLIIDHVLKALVGEGNLNKASRGFNGNKFHTNILNCRVFLGDETPITESSKETLKDYHSKTAAIEEKFSTLTGPREMHASIFITNNYDNKICLDYSDRKFFVPDLNTEKFPEEIAEGEVLPALKKDEELKKLADYLYSNFKEGDSAFFNKDTKTYNRCTLYSYPARFRDVIATHEKLNGNKAFFSRAELFGRSSDISMDTIQTLFDRYEKERNRRIGEATIDSTGTITIVLNPDSKDKSKSKEESHV